MVDDKYKLYTLDNKLIGEGDELPINFTGILIIDPIGSKYWFLNGKQHRIDGPAIEWSDGSKFWYLNDKLHRTDGPASEYANGSKEWYIYGKCITTEQHKLYVDLLKLKGLL